jgi:hypothetical protein
MQFQRQQTRFLLKLYELAAGNTLRGIPNGEICESLNLSEEDNVNIVTALAEKSWAKFHTFGHVVILVGGIEKAEQLMARTFLEKQNEVLLEIYEMRGPRNIVVVPHLIGRLDILAYEVYNILSGLEEKGWIEWGGGDMVRMKQAGIEAIEAPKDATPLISYTTNVQTNYGGIQQGHGNVQQINHREPLSKVLPQLSSFVEAVRQQDFEDKEDVIRDLEKALEVARANPGALPGEAVWTRVQSKLVTAKTAMELANLTYNTLPFWAMLWHYFTH